MTEFVSLDGVMEAPGGQPRLQTPVGRSSSTAARTGTRAIRTRLSRRPPARIARAIIAVDRDEAKLELALARGATHAVAATGTDVVAEVRTLTGGGVERAFEVVGNPVTIRQAWDVLRPGGTAIVVGLAPAGIEVSLPAIEFLSEKTITGSYYGSTNVHAALGRLVQLVVDGRLDLGDVVQYLISLDDLEAALDRLRRGHGARSVIVMDEQLAGVGA